MGIFVTELTKKEKGKGKGNKRGNNKTKHRTTYTPQHRKPTEAIYNVCDGKLPLAITLNVPDAGVHVDVHDSDVHDFH